MDPVDRDRFRGACSRYATGITILTVVDTQGAPRGMTANSFTSVSLDPPLVLACVDHSAAILAHFRSSGFMGINVLNETQRHLSMHFARAGEDRFGEVEWYAGRTGVPLLPDALATLECSIVNAVDAGDHDILIGEVLQAGFREGKPLLYFDRAYRAIG